MKYIARNLKTEEETFFETKKERQQFVEYYKNEKFIFDQFLEVTDLDW